MLQVHHRVASIISNDAELLQCARVVTWLEELAGQSLDDAAEQGQGDHLPKCIRHSSDGVMCCILLLT